MPIQIALHHSTRYLYDRPVHLGPQIIRLRPAPHCRTRILEYSLTVVPAQHSLHWQQDPVGNHLARLLFRDSTSEFAAEVDLVTEMTPINPFDFFLTPEAGEYPFRYDVQTARQLCPYVDAEPAGPLLTKLLAEIPKETTGTMAFLVNLNNRLQGHIGYVRRPEPGIQSCEETLSQGKASCRDSAWLFVQVARHLGLAARFVSGYLIQLADDSADLHAWAEVYLPGAGWVGFDPTSGLLATEGHIPLACTPDAASAAPISGSVGVCESEFHHEVKVTRL